MWLAVVDTTQIQPYVFGSNRLRENVGASYLVDAATGAWAFEAVKQAAPAKHNISPDDTLNDGARIEQGLEAEVLYAGGGNFVVLFDDLQKAQRFQFFLSKRVLEEAPGLQLVIAQQELDWHADVLPQKLEAVLLLLAEQKRKRSWSAPLLGLGVTAACNSTGLPATGIVPGIGGDPGYLASDEIRAKVDVATRQGSKASEADQRLRKDIPLQDTSHTYPADFEDLGATRDEYSYIAIVHADGNGMSQRIREIGNDYQTAEGNRAYVQALRSFSHNVQQAAMQALQSVLGLLTRRIKAGEDGSKYILYQPNPKRKLQIKLMGKDGQHYLPFRPIVFGGDDVTFVCDGRLGLSLATAYLRAFERQTQRAGMGKDGRGLTACAGITIVKNHYPFARAYDLASELTSQAKSYREQHQIPGSCLDWHFAMSGLDASLEKIRQREYQVHTRSLNLRPVSLDANSQHEYHAWPVVEKGIQVFQKEEWAERRNKVKALRDALREGPDAVQHFRVAFQQGSPLPDVLPPKDNYQTTGWFNDGSCAYFDAIELADWFIPLEGESNDAAAVAFGS